MVAPTGVNDESSAEPADQELPEPLEPLTPAAAAEAEAADAGPGTAEIARPELAAAEPVTTQWVEPAGPGRERETER
jgi:hypothetical protein